MGFIYMDTIGVGERLTNLSNDLGEDLSLASDLFAATKKRFNIEEQAKIELAFKCANDLHRGQKRKSGEPYIIHPINVALIIMCEMHLRNPQSIIAGLLHDVVEDTKATTEMLKELFGEEVSTLVDGVSKIKNMNHTSKDEEKQYNDCKLLRTCANDIRDIIIKIADRLHNMRTMIYKGTKEQIAAYEKIISWGLDIEDLIIVPNYKQIEKSAETYALFVPLADRIGASKIRDELLHLSFMYLQNGAFHACKKNLEMYKQQEEKNIATMALSLGHILGNIDHDIHIGYRSLFDIYTSLRRGKLKINDLPKLDNIVSFEVVVDDKDACYKVARLFEKKLITATDSIDYIETPRANGYRAIHLFVKDKSGHTYCIKICSRKMKLINDYGLAALTEIYPDKTMAEIQSELNNNNAFVSTLKSIEELSKDNASFLRLVREELLSKQIEVITKDHERISLPRGATALDFAYKIHSEIGNQATAALVNGSTSSLDRVLSDGDVVIIITNPHQIHQPREYIDFVRTYTARKKIREGCNRANTLVRSKQ